MSAIQKYKKEAQELKEQNLTLQRENEALKAECKLLHDGVSPVLRQTSEDVSDHFWSESKELTKRLVPLAYDSAARPLMASLIEEALHKAYALGKEG